VADARDFDGQAISLESVGDADAVMFPEIGVALVGGEAAQARSMSEAVEIASDSPVESIDPERFVFVQGTTEEYLRGIAQAAEGSGTSEYLRGFLRAAETIIKDLQAGAGAAARFEVEEEVMVSGATWGLNACRVPQSVRSGTGIKVAVLDTGMDVGHPDFAGRSITTNTFVGQPVQDLNSHGTHMIGTACGPKAPAGSTPRYGIGFKTAIFVGKVLSNSGSGSTGSVLAGMNWAVANRCQVILIPLAVPSQVQPIYTAAGQAALNNGCLMIAGSGGNAGSVPAPANSPTIMSVAPLGMNLAPTPFANFGKVEIAAPGQDIFSSAPRPTLYKIISGTASAAAHVAGCAALWAETSSSLRGMNLWRKLQATARRLPFPASRVGAGLVQAP
jgi:hypothetical protein